MKKMKIFLVFSFVLSFSGCFIKEKDITQIVFPIAVMISKTKDKYRLHMLVLSNSISSKIEVESGLHDTMYHTIIFEGDTISEASEKMGVATNGNISAIKIRSLILHESLFENNKTTYRDLTAYIINNPLYRTNIYVYYSKDDPDVILNINSLNFSTNTHFYLTRPDQRHLNDFLLPSKLLNTAKAYSDNKRMFYLPSLAMSNEHLKQESDGELKQVNTHTIDGGYFLTKKGDFKYVSVNDLEGLKWKNEDRYFDIELGSTNELINVKIEKVNWTTSIIDNEINVKVKVISKINYNHTSLTVDKIEDLLSEYVYNEIVKTYKTNYKDIDIYWFNDFSYRTNKKIENNETFNLSIDTTIKNTIYQF